MAAFSYKHNPFTPEQYAEMLEKLGKLFVKWRLSNDFYRTKELHQAYRLWWFAKGPTGFSGSEDRLRFKQELFNHIMTMTGTNETTSFQDTNES